ncbi:hypothetical protein QO004_003575 [Rhizobium mesoamericanum]|uniref:hypothetical protein n=1 Tax=Rhizobium mesoamericanum TaxID=1079800 RepID=UPI002784EC69|nr:hypothetical protein [Rhizobium mesoamericanum]MDQ0561775.1 hypothetical protein [Rhizobium mesoamericanum]
MDCAVIEQESQARAVGTFHWFSGFGRRLLRRLSQWDRLELEGMPDRIKRDLGFLDGQEPRYDREFWQ